MTEIAGQFMKEHGIAVRTAKPSAPLLALTILSPAGQKTLATNGFKPLANPDARYRVIEDLREIKLSLDRIEQRLDLRDA